MKRSILTTLLVFATMIGMSQSWTPISNSRPTSIKTTLVASSESKITVNVQVPGFNTLEVVTPRGTANVISVPKAVSTSEAGEPNLPMIAIPAIIGDQQHYAIKVIDAQYIDYDMEVAPSKGFFSRQVDPEDVPYVYGEAYSTDAFFPKEQVGLYDPYILRDFRGQNMVVYPFAYNPASKTLRVYYDLTVEMYSDGAQGRNTMTRKSNTMKLDPEFKAMYEGRFINCQASMNRYTPVNETGRLLIICHDAFIDAMQPYVNWKKQIGIPTTIVGTSVTGSTSDALKAYTQAQYDNDNSISHILLVGDNAQIQGYYAYNGGYSGRSDNWYGQVAGNDYYNDVIVGRFSAETVEHVTTQVNKVITYERDLNASDTWLTYGTGVATTAGNGGHFGEDDWVHIDNIKADLLGYNYEEIYRDYQNAGGANSNANTLSQHINQGLSIINYCNHGSETSWGVFGYSNSNVNALTNVNKLPFVWSVACLNGKYDHYQPCFAEAWMRATNGNDVNQPTGAIGGMFSYISQPWVPPMYGQDEMVDVLVESYENNIKRTLGGVSFDGNMKIIDQYGTNNSAGMGTYMCWILYGDPTLAIRNAVPTEMGIVHNPVIPIGTTSFEVTATDAEGARATLTVDNEIMGSAVITDGVANIEFETPTQAGEALLTVIGFNKITYIATINIVSSGEDQPVSVTVTANPTIITRGSSTMLNAQATGGNWQFSYDWTPSETLNNSNIKSPMANPTTTTTYTCTVTSGTYSNADSCTVIVVCPPENLTTIVDGVNVQLSWDATEYADSYKVYRNNTLIAQGITETTFTDTNLAPGTYSYQVGCTYQGVGSPKSTSVNVTVAPTVNVTATADGNKIKLHWDPITSASSYRVFQDNTLIAEITAAEYIIENLANGTYCFSVSVVYPGFESPRSNEACAEVDVCIAPGDFEGYYYWEDMMFGTRLSWSKDQSVNMSLVRFNIYRGVDPDHMEKIASQVNVPYNYHYEYMDEDVLPGEYYYMVGANYGEDECYTEPLLVAVTNLDEQGQALKVYPNPTQGSLTIMGEGELSIVNSLGQTMIHQYLDQKETKIDLAPFGKGIYMLILRSGQGVATQKIIVD